MVRDLSNASITCDTLVRFGVIEVMVSCLAKTLRMTGRSAGSAGAGFSFMLLSLDRAVDTVGDGKSAAKVSFELGCTLFGFWLGRVGPFMGEPFRGDPFTAGDLAVPLGLAVDPIG